jgi:hypothetical protein
LPYCEESEKIPKHHLNPLIALQVYRIRTFSKQTWMEKLYWFNCFPLIILPDDFAKTPNFYPLCISYTAKFKFFAWCESSISHRPDVIENSSLLQWNCCYVVKLNVWIDLSAFEHCSLVVSKNWKCKTGVIIFKYTVLLLKEENVS